MADDARNWTDAQLDALERNIAQEYEQAAREMREELEKALKKYAAEKEQREKALDDTPEAKKAHKEWLAAQAVNQARLREMVESLSYAANHANEMAMAALNDELPRIYAENANRAAYSIDSRIGKDTAFALVDEDTVRYLMQVGNGTIIPEVPRPEVDTEKDLRWNRQKFTSAITQGILQGESIPNIAKRIESVVGMNKSAAVRAARTATTGAENAGRVSSYQRAERLGIDLKQEWLATLDERTRYSHRQLDGERVAVGEKFSNGCRYPGDPEGPASECWNCRCTLIAAVEGVDDEGERWSNLPEGMTYEEWKNGKNKRDSRAVAPDPEWDNARVLALETVADVRKYIESNHEVTILGPFEKMSIDAARGIAAGLDEGRERFGHGAATTLEINNRLQDPGYYGPSTGKICVKANKGGTYLTALHEYVHSVDDLKSSIMGNSSGKISYNIYSDSLIDRACKNLGIKRGGGTYSDLIAGMRGLDKVMARELEKPHELLAYSVERERVGKTNKLSSELVRLLEADNA